MPEKWVYLFDEYEAALEYARNNRDNLKALLGGKGINLGEMTYIGLPVPPGFTVTTEACLEYLNSGGAFPEGMWEEELEALEKVEEQSGKKFGDPNNPLLVSCRSGAKFSMPGMMDTVLNIGLNEETARGMVEMTGDERFVYDLYRRLVQMFGAVVMGIHDDKFEDVLTFERKKLGIETDTEFSADDWKRILKRFKEIYRNNAKSDFPEDPKQQLRLATEAVFSSWNGKRAVDYRKAAGIPDDLGTAVNIQTMVFGNMGNDSATGVAMTRNGSTGEKKIEGDYLINAQGEDVVAGIRMTKDIHDLQKEMPKAYEELTGICDKLERHYREMQDIEFTIEKNKLWMLQTRDGKRTAQAAVKIACDMVNEELISKDEAVMRIMPEQVDFFLHPQFDQESIKNATNAGKLIAEGLNVSPGAAVGVVVLDADLAEQWSKQDGKKVIMIRPETKPDDVHGMLASEGIVTSRGGRTSHAALVARQFGKPAVVGVSDISIEMGKRQIRVGEKIIKEGDWISIDGTQGNIYMDKVQTTVPDIDDPNLKTILEWADEFRRLGVWTNADYPRDAKRARSYGAEGIGLCRTEHMFFEGERMPFVQKMIMTDIPVERREALDSLLPFQREDFIGLFRAMDGLPVIIRLLDPPLHEFLPDHGTLLRELSDLKIRVQHAQELKEIDEYLQQIRQKERILRRVESLSESNPMLGMRGVRLGIHIPEVTIMQVRAIFEAACTVADEGIDVKPEIMIPLTSHVNELKVQQEALEEVAKDVLDEFGLEIDYKFGTMIEIPRAALTADQIAEIADFFSFGTNDLTQTTFGISRDDAEAAFLIEYMESGILPDNPFDTIDVEGVGQLMEIAVTKARQAKPDLECGICGEHGGDPKSIQLCHKLNLDYVSCSPLRVPIARLAAAHAAIREKKEKETK